MDNLTELLKNYRDLKRAMADDLSKLDSLTRKIKAAAIEQEVDRVDVLGASIKVGAPQQRVKWNTKALDGFAVAYPELRELRQEYKTKPSVRIVVD